MDDYGVVVIGRNEGERLRHCLLSIRSCADLALPVVYVDSGSSDDSVALAGSFGVVVHELSTDQPFSAARARNEGYQVLVHQFPFVRFVQFIDGDCTLISGWLESARDAFEANPKRAAVIGNLVERFPDASTYNRLCAMEWRSPPGDLTNFGHLGGLSMMRVEVLAQLGGFNARVIAGEDSELGVRMGLAGYAVTKIGHQMATHDANILFFRQWWQRSIRAGHAIAQRAYLNGKSALRDCARERNSTLLWGVAIPVIAVLGIVPTRGLSLILMFAYLYLGIRVIKFRIGSGDSLSDAVLYAKYVLLAKFANGLGLIRFYLNRIADRYQIIEYK